MIITMSGTMNLNPNGRLAIYANSNGRYYGRKVVEELNLLLAKNNFKGKISLKLPEVSKFPNSML